MTTLADLKTLLLSGGSQPSLDLNFLLGALPLNASFSRSGSTATYFDATGTLQNAGANVPRFDHSPTAPYAPLGYLHEAQASTNQIGNSTMQGAVIGTPGTYPTNWIQSNNTGLSANIVNVGTESGISFVDFQISGTATGSGQNNILWTLSAVGSPGNNQKWTESVYLKLVSGSFANVGSLNLYFLPNVGGSNPALTFPTNAALATQRQSGVITTSSSGTSSWSNLGIVFGINAGAVNFTVRVGAPQLEQSPFASSFIPTSSGAVTRNADALIISNLQIGLGRGGALVASYTLEGAAGANQVIAQLDDGTSNNAYSLTGGTSQVIAGQLYGGTSATANIGAVAFASAQKAAVAWNGRASLTSALNGSAGGVVTGGQQTSTLTILRIGNNVAGTSPGSLWLKEVMVYGQNQALSQINGYTRQ